MQPDGEVHVYHIGGPLRRNAVRLIFGLFAGGMVLVGAISTGNDRAAGWLIAAFLLLLGLGMDWLVTRARLEVSATGLRLRQTGYELETPWANVESLRMDKGHEGFVTKEPMKGHGAERLCALRGVSFGMGRMPIYDRAARQFLYEQRYIPIEAFAWHVRRGKLGDELSRLAPHVRLVSDDGKPKAASTPEQGRENRKALLLIFGATAVVLALAFSLPVAVFDHLLPAFWALFAAAFALQGARLARFSVRTGGRWMAVFYVVFTALMALWSLGACAEAIAGKSLSKQGKHVGKVVRTNSPLPETKPGGTK